MEILGIIIGGILGGLANRIRGGWLSDKIGDWFGMTFKRIFFGLVIALLAVTFGSLDLWTIPVIVATIWFGMTFPWGEWYHVRDLKEFGIMSLRGLVVTALSAPATSWWAVTGLCMGGAYWLGRKLNIKIPNFHQGPELGELIFGAILGATITVI